MLTIPFLTQLDSRAAIKGSRDPLGIQPIWARLGRHVVGNLTTVSNSVRDFTVLLLGHYFAERVADEGGAEGDLATFLKWEQLAGYARAHVNKESGFRGTERVARRLADDHRVLLGVGSDAQILSNQKIYGLWGLYTVPAKASGLLGGDPTRLSPPARQIVEERLLPRLESAGSQVVNGIASRLRLPEYSLDVQERSRDATTLKGVARVLSMLGDSEKALYREHLLHGGPADRDSGRGTQGQQQVFAELLAETLDEPDWALTPETIRTMADRALKHGAVGEQLASRLERIRAAESVLAPAAAFYEHLLGCDGQTPDAVADEVRRHWERTAASTIDPKAVEALEPELRASGDEAESGHRWVRLAAAFHDARYEDAIPLVLEQNAAIMRARSTAAPWADIRDGKLRVRFRDEQLARLPEAKDLPGYWRHAYFIDSLRAVAGSLRAR